MQTHPSCGYLLLNWWPWPDSRSLLLYGCHHSRCLEAWKTIYTASPLFPSCWLQIKGKNKLDYCPKHTPADTSRSCNCNGKAECIIRQANLIKNSKRNRMWSTESSSRHATRPMSRLGGFPSLLYTGWWKRCSQSYLNNKRKIAFLLFSSGTFCRLLIMHKIIIIDWPPST